jgi:hypothetical protein
MAFTVIVPAYLAAVARGEHDGVFLVVLEQGPHAQARNVLGVDELPEGLPRALQIHRANGHPLQK